MTGAEAEACFWCWDNWRGRAAASITAPPDSPARRREARAWEALQSCRAGLCLMYGPPGRAWADREARP